MPDLRYALPVHPTKRMLLLQAVPPDRQQSDTQKGKELRDMRKDLRGGTQYGQDVFGIVFRKTADDAPIRQWGRTDE